MPQLGKVLKTFVGKKEGRIDRVYQISAGAELLCAPLTCKAADGVRIIITTADGRVLCFHESYKKEWEYQVRQSLSKVEEMFVDKERSQSIHAMPAVLYRNSQPHAVIFGADTGKVYSLSMKGKLQWEFATKGAVRVQPLVADINNDRHAEIVFGSGDNKLYALSEEGKLLWDFEAESAITSSAQLLETSQGRRLVVFGSSDGNVYAIDGKGTLAWK